VDSGLWTGTVSHKSEKITALIESLRGRELDAHYLGYFECFNQQLFFEAHEVLEELWLAERGGPRDLFYKGLIQLAGAFVHFQKNRLQPAGALLKLAQANLSRYPSLYEGLETANVREMIGTWLAGLQPAGWAKNPLSSGNNPKLVLQTAGDRDRQALSLPPESASA
jgi:hypothetical protein